MPRMRRKSNTKLPLDITNACAKYIPKYMNQIKKLGLHVFLLEQLVLSEQIKIKHDFFLHLFITYCCLYLSEQKIRKIRYKCLQTVAYKISLNIGAIGEWT